MRVFPPHNIGGRFELCQALLRLGMSLERPCESQEFYLSNFL